MTSNRSRNRLNDLSGKEWLGLTKTVIMNLTDHSQITQIDDAMRNGVLMSDAPPRDLLKKSHPATFSERDIAKLIRFFTRQGELVLDPFMGSGSTAIACLDEGRNFIGFELYEEWIQLASRRVQTHPGQPAPQLIHREALHGMQDMADETVDFIVTSPPYWGLLQKVDHKAQTERVAHGLTTNYGTDNDDLANITEYHDFIASLSNHFAQYARLLKPRKYAAVIVSDFRHGGRYYLFHAHLSDQMERNGFVTHGIINLVQDNKKLYPYGYPTTFVPNVSNQFIIVARKLGG